MAPPQDGSVIDLIDGKASVTGTVPAHVIYVEAMTGIFEAKLGDEFLMSSLFTVAEIEVQPHCLVTQLDQRPHAASLLPPRRGH